MMSYQFKRRSFLASLGGAVGFEILLRNLEAGAAGMGPPPRFLMMHWPTGNMRQAFVPTGTGMSWTGSTTHGQPGYILSPFATPELKPLTTILYGLSMQGITGQGGGHEDGTPFCTTGADSPGTRSNGGEADDGVAGGPSWDQVLLKNVPALSKKDASGTIIGKGFYNSICDARIDSNETSTRCLSYGYTKVGVASARPGGTIMENQPLKPELIPANAYSALFSGFMPGTPDVNALRLLKQKKSVLDHSLRELGRLNTLAPAAERVKIDAHMQIIRQMEAELTAQINNPPTTGGGMAPPMPDASLKGQTADRLSDYGNPISSKADGGMTLDGASNSYGLHHRVGQAHMSILRAAFACDLIRVGTFQWSPGTNHVAFSGLDPNSSTIYMHHPLSHRQGASSFFTGPRPGTDAYIWDAMVSAQYWYFARSAELINSFRTTLDPLATDGSNLLERMVIPMVTEVGDASHTRSGHSALIVGGQKLGMIAGGFRQVSGSHNQIWASVAQAYVGASGVSGLMTNTYPNADNRASALSGLWAAPT
jgi:hypothetical protein